jgi:hypothetical protein
MQRRVAHAQPLGGTFGQDLCAVGPDLDDLAAERPAPRLQTDAIAECRRLCQPRYVDETATARAGRISAISAASPVSLLPCIPRPPDLGARFLKESPLSRS